MNNDLLKLWRVLSGRAALNIYFWAFVILPRIDVSRPLWINGMTLLLFAFIIIPLYINNLLLVPRFLSKKRYGLYFSYIVPILAFFALCYSYSVYESLKAHPDATEHTISLIISSATPAKGPASMIFLRGVAYFFFLVALTFIFTTAWYMRDYAHQQKIAEELRKKQTETELMLLKGQLNPHFLFNTLNNLYGLTLEKSDMAPDAVLKLSSILRYLLYESGSEDMPFEKEEEMMRAYIDLELLRLPKKDNMNFTIHSDTRRQVPSLLWLPVLENVFKHGTRFADRQEIEYRYEVLNNKLNIYSKNRFKPGIDNKLNEASGIGLNNLKQRLEFSYNGKYTLQANEADEYYIVQVSVNLE